MSRMKKNIFANLVGSGWMAMLSFIFIPLYIHFLGIEAYGLIGFYSMLLAALSRLDMGLKAAMTRELAQRSVQENQFGEIRDLVRTVEVVYWSIAAVILLLVLVLSPVIVDSWVNYSDLSRETVLTSVSLMGVVFTFEFTFALYVGALVGLQRQVLLNKIIVVTSTLRFAGAVMVLWLVSSTIEAFFYWQVAVTFVQLIAGVYFLWKVIGAKKSYPQFQLSLLKNIWKFASGMMGISFVGFFIMQLPLIVLSKMLPLQEFAYYSLAMQLAFLLLFIIGPVVTAVSPQLCSLVAQGDELSLKSLYHKGCQIVTITILPVAIVLCFFAKEFLFLWTGNPQVVENAYLLVIVLTIGSALNGLVNMPSSLMMAYGWTRLTLQINSVTAILLVPLLFYFISQFGAVGAALVWFIQNLLWVLIGIYLLHRRYLIGELKKWYWHDIGIQLVGCVAVAVVARTLVDAPLERVSIFFVLAVVWICAFVVAVLLSQDVRPAVRHLFDSKIRGFDEFGKF